MPIEDEEDPIAEEQQSSIESISDLRNAIGIDSFIKVGEEEGLLCYCGDVECVIEMKLYRYSRQKWPLIQKIIIILCGSDCDNNKV